MSPTLLHVSPHPDDEVLGAGSTLQLMKNNGWRVVNLACSLGRMEDRERRGAELEASSLITGIENVIIQPPILIKKTDNMQKAREQVTSALTRLLLDLKPEIVVSPQLYDGHHGHDIVAQTVQDVLQSSSPAGVVWWQWGWWRELPHPTLYVPFGEETLARTRHAISAYTGENERNDYLTAYRGKAMMQPALGSERIFGLGSPRASEEPYAELLTESIWQGSEWTTGNKRILNPADALN